MGENTDEKHQPIIEVLLPGAKSPLPFFSFDEIKAFIHREASFWEWLQKAVSSDRNLNDIASFVNNQLKSLDSRFSQAEQVTGSARDQQDRLNLLKDAFSKIQIFLSESPRAKFIKKLADKDPVIAGFAAGHFLERVPPINSAKAVEGVFLATAFNQGVELKGVTSQHDVERSSLEQVRQDYRSKYGEDVKAFEELLRNVVKLKQLLEDDRAKFNDEHTSSLETAKNELKQIQETL